MTKRVFIIVLDSFGIGEQHDAKAFGDEGANTLRSIRSHVEFNAPNLTKLGLFNIDGVGGGIGNPLGSFAKMTEKSMGKDTTVGHWEIAGVISPKPMPTFPNGFPEDVVKEFELKTGRRVICNKPYSGTEVIKDYGEEHLKTGALIVYTSVDSVFQIASHTAVVSEEELYSYCKIAREILVGDNGVGRVIARPFDGEYPFKRTSGRHDFSIKPPKKTLLDVLSENGLDVISVGKIYDIFAGSGITKAQRTVSNDDGMDKTIAFAKEDFNGLCFTNLVDFDTVYGHRNDSVGYARAVTEFDKRLGELIKVLRSDDILIITADHGCDPMTEGTDHTREHTPMLIFGANVKQGLNLGIRESFADISRTVLDAFGIENTLDGKSFYAQVKR